MIMSPKAKPNLAHIYCIFVVIVSTANCVELAGNSEDSAILLDILQDEEPISVTEDVDQIQLSPLTRSCSTCLLIGQRASLQSALAHVLQHAQIGQEHIEALQTLLKSLDDCQSISKRGGELVPDDGVRADELIAKEVRHVVHEDEGPADYGIGQQVTNAQSTTVSTLTATTAFTTATTRTMTSTFTTASTIITATSFIDTSTTTLAVDQFATTEQIGSDPKAGFEEDPIENDDQVVLADVTNVVTATNSSDKESRDLEKPYSESSSNSSGSVNASDPADYGEYEYDEYSGDYDSSDTNSFLGGFLSLSIRQAFSAYLERMRRIYELDLQLLQQLSSIIESVSLEALPQIANSIRPLLKIGGKQVDLVELINLVRKGLGKATYEASVYAHFEDLDFIEAGPRVLDQRLLADPYILHHLSSVINAQFDKSGLGFPIRALFLKPSLYYLLNDRSQSKLLNKVVAEKLRQFVLQSHSTVSVGNGEIVFDSVLKPLHLAKGCRADIKSDYGRAVAVVKRSSVLRAAVSSSPNKNNDENENKDNNYENDGREEDNDESEEDGLDATLFLSGDLDVSVDFRTRIQAMLGKSFFGKCLRKFSKTMPLHVYSYGNIWLGVRLLASDMRIENATDQFGNVLHHPSMPDLDPFIDSHNEYEDSNEYSKYSRGTSTHNDDNNEEERKETANPGKVLVFRLDVQLAGRINRWQVDRIGIRNCDLRVLGLRLFSFCKLIRDRIRRETARLTHVASIVHMPKLLNRIEHLLRARIGNEIVIPLVISDTQHDFLKTLFKKADEIGNLKTNIASDLALITELIAQPDNNKENNDDKKPSYNGQ